MYVSHAVRGGHQHGCSPSYFWDRLGLCHPSLCSTDFGRTDSRPTQQPVTVAGGWTS